MPVQCEDVDGILLCAPLPPVIEMPSEFAEEETNLLPCSSCNRTFNPKALQRHENVCQKVQLNKRNVFDPSKQRVGDEALSSLTRSRKNNVQPKKKSRWREKHAEFLQSIRTAKTTSDDSDDGSPQRMIPSDYIKCPHCERFFGPKAADRHISWCEEQKTRLPRTNTEIDDQATNRLKTRTKYAPPKPGQSGWRAPKKKDVISSIPPPNIGANITPPGRLISPPPVPSNRHFSPPPNNYRHRNVSPPSVSSSRRRTLASLPTGPPRYSSTSSLGRSAGKQFSTMLQSMTGCPTGYGLSTGYGSSYLYGSPNQGSTFNRTASLRLPRNRPAGSKRMARHRDLASDMLSSVSVDGGKRQEPEGGEDRIDTRRQEHSSYKMDNAPYDPYSAAELQFQDLLGPSKPGVGLRSDMMMGSTGSLKGLGLTRQALERRDYSSPQKRSLGTMSLCSFRLDPFDHLADELKSPEDLSEVESMEGFSNGMQSPIDEFEDLLASLTTANTTGPPKNDYNRQPEQRNGSLMESISYRNKSPSRIHDTADRIRPDGSYSWRKTPSPPYSILRRSPPKESSSPPYSILRRSPPKESSSPPYLQSPLRKSSPNERSSPPYAFSPLRRSPSKERISPPYSFSPMRRNSSKESSPPYQLSHTPTTGLNKIDRGYSSSTTPNTYGWTNTDYFGSSQNYSRHLRKTSPSDEYQTSKSYLNPRSSKVLPENKNVLLRLDENQQRMSSGSSTDSSLPVQSSPMSSSIEPLKRITNVSNNTSSSTMPKFCYECGNKFPVSMAKFCCQCGAPRVTV